MSVFTLDNDFNSKLNDLLSQVSLIEIMRQYSAKVNSNGSGKYMVSCPFHKDGQEKKPSMSVDEQRGLYYCFTCGEKGNALSLVRAKMNYNFKEAVHYLGSRFGVNTSSFDSKKKGKKDTYTDKVFEANEYAMKLFGKLLLKKDLRGRYLNPKPVEYLKGRGMKYSSIRDFKLGFAVAKWDMLTRSMIKAGFSEELLINAGLIKKKNSSFDRFINRIIFPIINERGKVLGFGGRIMGGSGPKYLNSPETPVFKKKRVLYGIHMAKDAIRQKDEALFVEGYMDVIACHQNGINTAVAALGTALTEEHIKYISRFTKNVCFAFDNDDAGNYAALSALKTALKNGLSPFVFRISSAKDLDEYLQKHDKRSFDILYKDKLRWYEFFFKLKQEEGEFSTLERKLEVLNDFFDLLRYVKNELAKSEIINFSAKAIDIDKEALKAEYDNFEKRGTAYSLNAQIRKSAEKSGKGNGQTDDAEKELFYLLAIHPAYIKYAAGMIQPELLKNQYVKERYARFLFEFEDKEPDKIEPFDIYEIVDNREIEKRIEERRQKKQYSIDVKKKIDDCINAIYRKRRDEERESCIEQLAELGKDGDLNGKFGDIMKVLERLDSYK